MLNPNNDRLDYGEILSAPEGYKLDFAVGTTYSLDLDALLGACLSLGMSQQTDSSLIENPVALLLALQVVGERTALFCENGQIHTLNNFSPLYSLLEKTVFAVNPKEDKRINVFPSFHPKFWLLKFVDKDRNAKYRIVVLSRNLTFDRSWDVTFTADGEKTEYENKNNRPVADFLKYLCGFLPDDKNGKEKAKKINSIIREIMKVDFELDSKLFDEIEFIPMGTGKYDKDNKALAPLLKDNFDELLIMSPFLSKTIVREFNSRCKKENAMLFTRKASIENLDKSDCDKMRLFIVKDIIFEGEDYFSDNFTQAEDDAEIGDFSRGTQDIQNQDIHAKLYMVRKNRWTYLYLGSMNSSYNAMNANVEFMIRLKAKSSVLNLERLSKSLFCDDENGTGPFKEVSAENIKSEFEENSKEHDLQEILKNLLGLIPNATVKENGSRYDLIIDFNGYLKDESIKIFISPVAIKDKKELSSHLEFNQLRKKELSEFYKIKISDSSENIERIVIIPTEGIPQDRDNVIGNSIVDNKYNLYRYLSYILGDDPMMSSIELRQGSGELGINKQRKSRTVKYPIIYEKMLKTAYSNPEKLKYAAFAFENNGESDFIPKELQELYNTFKKVVKI